MHGAVQAALKARVATLEDEHDPCPGIIESLRVEMAEVKAAHAPCAGIIAQLRDVPKAPPVICGVGMLLQSHDVSTMLPLLPLSPLQRTCAMHMDVLCSDLCIHP